MPAAPPRTSRKAVLILAGIVAGAAILTPGVGIAAKFLTPKKANKTFVRNMSAERGGAGKLFTNAAPHTIDVTIEATRNGYLLIQGSVHVDNASNTGPHQAALGYSLGGPTGVTAATTTLGPDESADIDPGETAQLSYVDVVPVSKGMHTVRQVLSGSLGSPSDCGGPGCGFEIEYEAEALVVTFFPGKGVTVG